MGLHKLERYQEPPAPVRVHLRASPLATRRPSSVPSTPQFTSRGARIAATAFSLTALAATTVVPPRLSADTTVAPPPEILVTPRVLTVDEGGPHGLLSVSLSSRPTANVLVRIWRDSAEHLSTNRLRMRFTPENWNRPQTVRFAGRQDADAADETTTLTITTSGGDYDEVANVTATVRVNDDEEPGVLRDDMHGLSSRAAVEISVTDASTREAPNAVVSFPVRLSRTTQVPVTVRYATSDGTARAAEDYVATSGTLTFQPGIVERHIAVSVMDDTRDEGEETLKLTLSNPSGAWIEDGEATGTIENSDPMPQAWLARFGRTVTNQVLTAVNERIAGPRAAGFRGSLGGQPVSFGGGAVPQADSGAGYALGVADEAEATAGLEALTAWIRGEHGARFGGGQPKEYTLTGREPLLGSSFSLTGGSAEGGYVAAWGRMAVSGFDGREDDLTLDGEVTTGMLGADFAAEGWKAGLVVSRSEGDGGYDSPEDRGEVSSTLNALHPWGSLRVSERPSLWAAAGYGETAPIEMSPGILQHLSPPRRRGRASR